MNLQHLEYLIEIENCGSISKAARRLFVTQPYLSRILKEVESDGCSWIWPGTCWTTPEIFSGSSGSGPTTTG